MKTPRNFEYDLWTTEEGRYFMRVKETGEVCEINGDTMRLLRREARRISREVQGFPTYGVENGKVIVVERWSMLSLDDKTDDKTRSSGWDVSLCDVEGECVCRSQEIRLRESFTPRELDVYKKCLLGGMTRQEYAQRYCVSEGLICQVIQSIRKKFKKTFYFD